MKIKILIVDDHPIVIDGLRSQIETQPDFVVVGATGDGLEVEELVKRFHPDILLLDLALPGLSGLEITRRVRRGLRIPTSLSYPCMTIPLTLLKP